MQSSWHRLARQTVIRWQTAGYRPFQRQTNFSRLNNTFHRAFNGVVPQNISVRRAFIKPPTEAREEKAHPPLETEPAASLTPAETAFAAAHAARLSVDTGNLVDAYLVLNSIFHANNKSCQDFIGKLSCFMPWEAFRLSAIPFRPGTPIRLVAHTTVHSMLRNGYHVEAGQLAEQLMGQGIRMHPATLDRVFEALTIPPSRTTRTPPEPHKKLWTRNVLNSRLDSTYINHAGGAHALRLLNLASKSRQQRTRKMFRLLVTLCVINGEIIAASLIFGLFVRHWNDAAKKQHQSLEDPPPLSPDDFNPDLHSETPWPSHNRLNDIVKSIDTSLRGRSYNAESQSSSALQALANLAVLLDHRLIPFASIDNLLKSICRAQSIRGSVYIPEGSGNGVRKVQASGYFKSVLTRLASDLPKYEVDNPQWNTYVNKNGGRLPALKHSGYNHLLHFALLDRHSPALAEQIVNHMTKERVPSLKPDFLTVETFRRAAVLMKDERLWEVAMSLDPAQDSNPQTRSGSLTDRYATSLATKMPAQQYARNIDFLASLGAPQAVVPYIDHILLRHNPKSQSLGQKKVDRRNRLMHSVTLGPRVFIAILNALSKSGKTGTAELVWEWAKEAEAFSWKQKDLPAWNLPIHAYTIMLKVYGAEAKRGARFRLVKTADGKLALSAKTNQAQSAIGFGRARRGRHNTDAASPPSSSLIGARSRTPTRGAAGREMAMEIYRSARSANETYQHARAASHKVHQDSALPVPDPTFFNQALDVVGRDPCMLPRSRVPRFYRAQRYCRKAEAFYKSNGVLPRRRRNDLIEVGRDMRAWGLPIPVAVRPYFVGTGVLWKEAEEEKWRKGSTFRLKVTKPWWNQFTKLDSQRRKRTKPEGSEPKSKLKRNHFTNSDSQRRRRAIG